MFLSQAIISLQAPGFLHERDKRAQFTGVLVVSACHSQDSLFLVLVSLCA